jgi:hypothetical protein
VSEKRQVPTFKVYLTSSSTAMEGPIVDPLKREVATHLGEVHKILDAHRALLVYAQQWVYVPYHSIWRIERGAKRFDLPWPLTDE